MNNVSIVRGHNRNADKKFYGMKCLSLFIQNTEDISSTGQIYLFKYFTA